MEKILGVKTFFDQYQVKEKGDAAEASDYVTCPLR